LIGSSRQLLGLISIPLLLSSRLLGLPLTTFPAKSKLAQASQRQIFLGLKIIGLVILAALIRFVAGNF